MILLFILFCIHAEGRCFSCAPRVGRARRPRLTSLFINASFSYNTYKSTEFLVRSAGGTRVAPSLRFAGNKWQRGAGNAIMHIVSQNLTNISWDVTLRGAAGKTTKIRPVQLSEGMAC